MSRDIIPKRTGWDVVHRLIKATISSVPIVGGPSAEIYDYFLVAPYTKRTEEFLKQLGLKLTELEERQSFDLDSVMDREMVKTTLAQSYLIWLRNHQEPKREALLIAFLNSITTDNADEDLEIMFLNFIGIFTTSHIELLEFLRYI